MAQRIFGRGPVPGLEHDCGDELRRDQTPSMEVGELVECSCGKYYTLREIGAFRYLFTVGRGNHRGRYPATAYWRYAGRRP
jgi:hypothetical protein